MKKAALASEEATYTEYLRDYYTHLQNRERSGKPVFDAAFENELCAILEGTGPNREARFVELLIESTKAAA